MTAPAVKISPQLYARTCGALYLYIIAAGIFAEAFVRSKLVVMGVDVAGWEARAGAPAAWRIRRQPS